MQTAAAKRPLKTANRHRDAEAQVVQGSSLPQSLSLIYLVGNRSSKTSFTYALYNSLWLSFLAGQVHLSLTL